MLHDHRAIPAFDCKDSFSEKFDLISFPCTTWSVWVSWVAGGSNKMGQSSEQKKQAAARAPLLLNRDESPVDLRACFQGASAFLIGGGPSLGNLDVGELSLPGCLTMAMNNAPKTVRPDLWVSVDDPSCFLRSIWLDPKIVKFAPLSPRDQANFRRRCVEVSRPDGGRLPEHVLLQAEQPVRCRYLPDPRQRELGQPPAARGRTFSDAGRDATPPPSRHT